MFSRFLVGIQGSRVRRKVRETYNVAPELTIIKNGWQDAEKRPKNGGVNKLRSKNLIFRPWFKDLAIFDCRFEFCMKN